MVVNKYVKFHVEEFLGIFPHIYCVYFCFFFPSSVCSLSLHLRLCKGILLSELFLLISQLPSVFFFSLYLTLHSYTGILVSVLLQSSILIFDVYFCLLYINTSFN